jgi:hypothetical protein
MIFSCAVSFESKKKKNPDLSLPPCTIYLKLGSKGDNGEGLSHGETLLPVDEERVGLDLEVVLQPRLRLQQVLHTPHNNMSLYDWSLA